MFIKFENGTYVNTNIVLTLGAQATPCDEREKYGKYAIVALLDEGPDAPAIVQSHFTTKTEAQAALDKLMAGKTCKSAECKQSPVHGLKPVATIQGETWYKFSEVLKNLVDDYELSGDEDNLLRINAYIRRYFAKDAKEDENE